MPKKPTLTGVDPLAYAAAAAGGDTFAASVNRKYLLHIKNAHTASQTVTLNDPTSQSPVSGKTFDPDVDVVVPNATERMVLIDNPARFIDASGNIALAYSGVTALTLQVFEI